MFIQSLRMTWRDWRAGEITFLLVAIIVAVGALSSVGFFVDRVSNGLQRDANQLLGGDVVISADAPIPSYLLESVNHLPQAKTVNFVSMASNEPTQIEDKQSVEFNAAPSLGQPPKYLAKLVSVKAVSALYPIRGKLTLENGIAQNAIPKAGDVWVDPAVLAALNIKLGEQIKLGDKNFIVSHLIMSEPDKGSAFINVAPRVMLSLDDLAATNLIQAGSRVTYRLQIAGDKTQVKILRQSLEKLMAQHHSKGISLDSIDNAQPEMRATLDRAQQFLSLVSLLSALLAALAIALSARRFMLRHIDAFAMMRCLGTPQNKVIAIFLIEFTLLGGIASLLGAALGFVSHWGLLFWLGTFISADLPAPSLLPGLQAVCMGMLLLIGFALPPLLQLRHIPHNLMVRRQTGAPKAHSLLAYLIGIVVFSLLLFWLTGNIKLAGMTLLGFLTAFIVFALSAWLFLKTITRLRYRITHPAWRFAINGLQRRTLANMVQIVALSLGLMALLLLTIIRADLVDAWRKATPVDAPNQFIINILPEQKQALLDQFAQRNIAPPELFPMIRGRLITLNQQAVSANDYEADNAKRMIEREFNLSTMQHMQSHNQIIQGQWFGRAISKNEASIEQGIAKTLHIKLGDTLTFDVGGQLVNVTVTSVRKLDWGSMRVNFFVIIDPQSAQNLPQTWITAFHLPAQQTSFISTLTQQFPNLSIIDTGAIIGQLQNVLNQVIAAVQFLFLFTLACGLLVLYAALQSSHQQRLSETALLRALGASRQQLALGQWIEYGLLGSVAGLLASLGAASAGWALAHFIFEFSFSPNWLLPAAGIVSGAICALLGGWIGLRKILNQPPLVSLRAG